MVGTVVTAPSNKEDVLTTRQYSRSPKSLNGLAVTPLCGRALLAGCCNDPMALCYHSYFVVCRNAGD